MGDGQELGEEQDRRKKKLMMMREKEQKKKKKKEQKKKKKRVMMNIRGMMTRIMMLGEKKNSPINYQKPSPRARAGAVAVAREAEGNDNPPRRTALLIHRAPAQYWRRMKEDNGQRGLQQ